MLWPLWDVLITSQGLYKEICGNYLGFRGSHFNEITLTQGSEGPPRGREAFSLCL